MRVTIVTTSFNSSSTIRYTIESVLHQTYTDIEYIIVDGGSTDHTLDIVREYEPLFNGRLRWISEPDKGIYDAMNKGVRMSSGDVIGFLNSDDFFTSADSLECLVDALRIHNVDAVYGDVHYVNKDNLSRCVRYYSSAGFRRFKMIFGYMPAHPTFYCRRKIFERHGLFDTSLKVASDFELLLRFIYVNRISTYYIKKDCVTMRTGGASTSGLASHRAIFHDHLVAYRKNGVRSNVLFDASRYILKSAEICRNKIYGIRKSGQAAASDRSLDIFATTSGAGQE